MLFDLINRPDFHVRLRWAPGTIAIWDNRGTQHYACADYLPHRRVMWRVAAFGSEGVMGPWSAPRGFRVASRREPTTG